MPDDLPANPAEMQPSRHSSEAHDEAREHRTWILGQVATMLSLYWQPDDSDLIRAAAGKVWADHLERFTQDEIAKACRRWIGKESRRPTPAEIIKLCVDARPRPAIVPTPLIERPVDSRTPEEKAEANAEIDAMMKDLMRKAGPGYGPVIKRIQRSGDE